MIIKKNVSDYIIPEFESLKNALVKIQKNQEGVVVCVSESGEISGILSDGDIRRSLIKSSKIDTNACVLEVANKNPICKKITADKVEIESILNQGLKLVPLIDESKKCIAIAINLEKKGFAIGNSIIGKGNPVYIIAEVGNNHQGCVETIKLVRCAKKAGANAVKFQLRDLKQLYGENNLKTTKS